MFSSIFSSRKFATAAGVAVFLTVFAVYEWHVSAYYFAGGFATVVDNREVKRALRQADRQGLDLIVIGSSRGKEAIRPSEIVTASSGLVPTAGNRACHSCSSVEAAREIVKEYQADGILRASRIVVTVEPLGFQKLFGANAERRGRGGPKVAEADGTAGVVNAARIANRKFLDYLNVLMSDALYSNFASMSPSQKRQFAQWMIFVTRAVRDPFDWRHIASTFDFVITSRMNRFYTLAIEVDDGFEGHTLKLAASDATRAEVRANQVGLYKTYVFPNYDGTLIGELAGNLKTIQSAGAKIVLVRLPIHSELYDLETAWFPAFDAWMTELADSLGVRYFPLQAAMSDFVDDDYAFTDGSHLENSRTHEFTRRLWRLIEGDLR